ncbi:MAG: HU family DNA-binding protein [Candidatus Electryoneaceae bacterium]|nr:HU family DNA-binding protein [Candidatus Electryoneaceae bacterium]
MISYIKKHLIKKTAEKLGMRPRELTPIVNAIFETLRDMMIGNNFEKECRIEIRNFGVFEVKRTAAKPKARNPKKPDEVIYVPARRKTLFRPGKIMKDELRKPFDG